MKQNSTAWSEHFGVIVLDPDGWDRSNFKQSWYEEIDELEFKRRLQHSTSMRGSHKNEQQHSS